MFVLIEEATETFTKYLSQHTEERSGMEGSQSNKGPKKSYTRFYVSRVRDEVKYLKNFFFLNCR